MIKAIFQEDFYQKRPEDIEPMEQFVLISKDQSKNVEKLNEGDWAFHIFDSMGRKMDTLNNLDSIRVTKMMDEIEAFKTIDDELYLAFS